MRSEAVMVVLAITVSMMYFCWIMSPKQIIMRNLDLVKKNEKKVKQLIVLAGQSNMMGVGGVNKTTIVNGKPLKVWDGGVPPESHPNPAVFRFNAEYNWELAHEPLHYGINCKSTCGVGIGMAFANKLLEMDPTFGVIGLVPCAAGGTSIANWSGDHKDTPYQVLLQRTKGAIEKGGNLRGMIWYQGESDTEHHYNARRYKSLHEKFINRFRNDLHFPTLPIYQVVLPPIEKPYIEEVRKAQREIDLPNIIKVEVEAGEFPLAGDHAHLTTDGFVQLGLKVADIFHKTNSKLLENKPVVANHNGSNSQL